MSRYYNTTRGPIAVSLSSGKAVSVPPKSWIEIDPGDEGSPNLVPIVRKGYLVRSALAATASAEAPTEAPPASVPVSAAAGESASAAAGELSATAPKEAPKEPVGTKLKK
jgi:hypothetical protein